MERGCQPGDLLAVAALFAWTLYFVASKRVSGKLPSFDYLVGMLIVATAAYFRVFRHEEALS